jgi:glycine dehydrogenase subunit 2
VPECLLIEPTETESKETLDNFVAAMVDIVRAAREEGVEYKDAPFKMPVRRLDDVKAARELDLRYVPE